MLGKKLLKLIMKPKKKKCNLTNFLQTCNCVASRLWSEASIVLSTAWTIQNVYELVSVNLMKGDTSSLKEERKLSLLKKKWPTILFMFSRKSNLPKFLGWQKSGIFYKNINLRSHLDGSLDKPSTFTVKLYNK